MLALLIGVQSAQAEKRRIPRSTTVHFEDLPGSTGDRVFGQLTVGQPQAGSASASSRCLAGQQVVIRHTLTRPGGGSPEPTVVGTATTDATGAWEFTGYEASGANQGLYDTFQVKLPKHPLGPKNARLRFVCLGASGFVTVPSD
jgi:hypothetical protein